MTIYSFHKAIAAAKHLHQFYKELAQFIEWDDTMKFQSLEPYCIPSFKALPLHDELRDSRKLEVYSAFCAPAAEACWRATYKDAHIRIEFNQKFGGYQLIGLQCHFFIKLNIYLIYGQNNSFYTWNHLLVKALYVIIAGEAVLAAAGRPLRRLSSADAAFHASNQPHGMTTEDKPVLACVLWSGDLKTPPILKPKNQQL